MSAKRVSLDTNILIYAIDKDDEQKQITAIKLIEKCALVHDCVLTLQLLSEFYSAATRKGKVSHAQAEAHIKDWQCLFPTILPSTHTVEYALKAVDEHSYLFGMPCSGQWLMRMGYARFTQRIFKLGRN